MLNLTENQEMLLRIMRSKIQIKDLCLHSGLLVDEVKIILARLHDLGLVEKKGEKFVERTEKGHAVRKGFPR